MAKISGIKILFICFAALIMGLVSGFAGNIYIGLPNSSYVPKKVSSAGSVVGGDIDAELVTDNDLSIHFLELGNKYTGDCTLIKVGDTEVLIDAGSRANSIPTLTSYIDQYCTDGILEYVIVTHAHRDHFVGFATGVNTDSLFDIYDIGTIIDFNQTVDDTRTVYKNYIREREQAISNGATHYTALDCIEGNGSATNIFDLGNNITLEILDNYYYHNTTSDENEYSVCTLISQDDNHYLFTGDLEGDGEAHLITLNNLPKVKLFKAGHHGSKTSNTTALLEVIEPEYVCVCCCAGSKEYTTNNENQFPTQIFINNIAPFTINIFVTTLCLDYSKGSYTSMNGNIVICSDSEKLLTIYCSNNATLLKDTDWFKANRIMPDVWASIE